MGLTAGFVIYLINWFHKYELLLQKVGFSSLDFSELRAQIKDRLPVFYENVRNVFSGFLQNVIRNEPQRVEELDLDEESASLDTQVPEDIASFLHQQLEFFVQNLSGDLFVKVFEIWKEELFLFGFTQSNRTKKLVDKKEQIPLVLVGRAGPGSNGSHQQLPQADSALSEGQKEGQRGLPRASRQGAHRGALRAAHQQVQQRVRKARRPLHAPAARGRNRRGRRGAVPFGLGRHEPCVHGPRPAQPNDRLLLGTVRQ